MVTAVDFSLVCVICTLQSKRTRGESEPGGEKIKKKKNSKGNPKAKHQLFGIFKKEIYVCIFAVYLRTTYCSAAPNERDEFCIFLKGENKRERTWTIGQHL